jgi:predicted MFS family arabinose efflux permease
VTAGEARGSREWEQHWYVLLPCIVGIMLASVQGYSLGVMIGPIEREFGWPRAEIASGSFIIACIALIVAPMVGIGVDRFGPRRIALIGVILFGAALAFISTTSSNVWSWWTRWAFLGVANMFILPLVWTAAINSLFVRNRGKALAIALCGTSLGATFVPALTNAMVESWGWRQAYIGLGVGGAVLLGPLAFFLFRGAADRGSRAESVAFSGYSARQGFANPAFLKLAGAAFVFSIASCALTSNGVPVLIAQGFSPRSAAATVALIGIGSLIGRLGGGILLDRFDAKKVAAASVLAPVVTVILLLLFPGQAWPAGTACLVLGLSIGTEVDACAYLAARHFGMRSFGTLFGTINGLLLFGTGFSPLASNYVYDVTRSYNLVLWALIPLCVMAALLFLALGRYSAFAEASNESRFDGASEQPALAAQGTISG